MAICVFLYHIFHEVSEKKKTNQVSFMRYFWIYVDVTWNLKQNTVSCRFWDSESSFYLKPLEHFGKQLYTAFLLNLHIFFLMTFHLFSLSWKQKSFFQYWFNSQQFHEGGPQHIETNPLICSANEWTGFYMIGTSVIKELKLATGFH